MLHRLLTSIHSLGKRKNKSTYSFTMMSISTWLSRPCHFPLETLYGNRHTWQVHHWKKLIDKDASRCRYFAVKRGAVCKSQNTERPKATHRRRLNYALDEREDCKRLYDTREACDFVYHLRRVGWYIRLRLFVCLLVRSGSQKVVDEFWWKFAGLRAPSN